MENYYFQFGSMSKIGNNPIKIPSTVQLNTDGEKIQVKGSQGELNFLLPKVLNVKRSENTLIIGRKGEGKKIKSMHGLFRQLIFNAVTGVETPWQKKLEVVGTGYNVKLQGEDLVFKLGYSHPVLFKKKPNIFYKVEGNNKVVVNGVDKQLVGQIAYRIKLLKIPDAYKGKGIRYAGEVLKLKPGKKVKTTTAGAA